MGPAPRSVPFATGEPLRLTGALTVPPGAAVTTRFRPELPSPVVMTVQHVKVRGCMDTGQTVTEAARSITCKQG